MIKILYIHPSLITGGAENLRYMFLKYVDKKRYDITVCCLKEKGALAEKIENMGFTVDCLEMSDVPYSLRTTFALYLYIRKRKFDIVQTSLFNANFHGRIAAKLAGVGLVFSEEHSEHYQYNSLKFVPYIIADKILSYFTKKIICCSQKLKTSISKLEKIDGGKFKVIINGIDIQNMDHHGNKYEARKKMGLNDTDIVIGNIAMLSKRKGQLLLVKAFAEIEKKYQDVKVVFIGDENLEAKEELLDLAIKLNVIDKLVFMGRQNDIPLLLKGLDVFVLSSLYEGIPLVLLEAMYMGLPVISTDVGGVSEVVEHDVNGILVPSGSVEMLVTAIFRMIEDQSGRELFVGNGKETVLKRHTFQRYVEQMSSLYSSRN